MDRDRALPIDRKFIEASIPVMLAIAFVAVIAALSIAVTDQSDGSEELLMNEGWNKCGDKMYWYYDGDDKILKFKGEGYMYNYDQDKDLDSYPPWNRYEFDTVYWGDSGSFLKSIGTWAFAYHEIKEFVFFDDNLEFINHRAFYCSDIGSFRSDDGSALCLNKLETIGVYAFESNRNTESFDLTFAPNLKRIQDNTFGRCFALKSVILPDSVESIGRHAFSGCKELETVTLPANLRTVDEYAFSDDAKLRDIQLPKGLRTIGDDAFRYTRSLVEIDFPDTLYSLGAGSFSGSGLREVTLPGHISIMNSAFRGCENLETINILSEATLSYDAFFECPSLKTIYLTPAANLKERAIHDCDSLENVIYLSEEKWPWSARSVPIYTAQTITIYSLYNASKGVFDNCEYLGGFKYEPYGYDDGTFYWYYMGETMFLDSTLTSSPKDAPYNPAPSWKDDPMYEKATSLHVGPGLEYIPDAGFMNSNLVHVDCSNSESLNSICNSAFGGCSLLNEIILPGQLTIIGDGAFKGCSNLQLIEFKGSENGFQYIGEGAFDLADSENATCFVISKDRILNGVFDQGIKDSKTYLCYVDVEELAMMWKIEGDTMYIYPHAKISDGTMQDYNKSFRPLWESDPFWSKVVKIKVTSGVRTIGDYAFYNCHDTGVRSVHVSSDCPLISIGSYAFRQEHETKGDAVAIFIDNWQQVKTIKDHAFAGCCGVCANFFDKAINLRTIGDSAFECCPNHTNILIPGSVEDIGDNAFANGVLRTITILPSYMDLAMGHNVFAYNRGAIDVYSWNNEWVHKLDGEAADYPKFNYYSINSTDDDGSQTDCIDADKAIATIVVFTITAIFIAIVVRRG